MSLPQVMHFAPKSIDEASRLLVQHPGARVLAGGTDLLVKMKQRRLVPRHVVNLKRIPGLDRIVFDGGAGLRVGALATLEELNRSAAVRDRFPMLHDAVASMGTLEIRHRGTLAGNLCNASPAAETVPPLMLLGALVHASGPSGKRTVPVAQFVAGPGRTVLQPGELVVEIEVPEMPPGMFGAYDKFGLRRMDLAIVGAAVTLELDDGRCRGAQIALSAVGPRVRRAASAEALLQDRQLDEAAIGEAAREAAAQTEPRSDLWGSAEYKREAAATLVERVLRRALERARKPS